MKKKNEEITDKNLKLMMLSASVLVALFIYTLIKSDSVMKGGSYYLGISFLLFLMVLAFYLQKYKKKIRNIIPDNKFQSELDSQISKKKSYETNDEVKISEDIVEAIHSDITFNDVAGIKNVKEELEEVVDFLNNPKKYTKHGVSLPKGVLLVGPPGVGKTLIARAVAGEANVPFFYQSGASFVHIYVGMGAKRVKELFQKAKACAPSIIFIDEIDAVGKARGNGGNDEREATLNELLTQMDGFAGDTGVMVIAATNKIDVLDDALLRAGRFDRRVILSLPSRSDRKKILELYLDERNYKFDIEKLCDDTSGFSSAALSVVINEGLLHMIKRGGISLLEDDISYAKQKVQYGTKELNVLCGDQKEILAIYQASKAFITQQNVSLFDEGLQNDDCNYPSKKQLVQKIKNNLAGSIGLLVIKKEQYAVFQKELKMANEIALDMKEKYNMIDSPSALIDKVKNELKVEFVKNTDEVNKLTQILLKEEKIVF